MNENIADDSDSICSENDNDAVPCDDNDNDSKESNDDDGGTDYSSAGESDTDFVDFYNVVEDTFQSKQVKEIDSAPSAVNIASARKWKMSEPYRRENVFSNESIGAVMRSTKCPAFRKSAACRNGNCLNTLGNVGAAISCVTNLRKKYYPKNGCAEDRKAALIVNLSEDLVGDEDNENERHIRYMIPGPLGKQEVCKGFYKMACAIPVKMFDEVVSAVEGTTNNHRIIESCNK